MSSENYTQLVCWQGTKLSSFDPPQSEIDEIVAVFKEIDVRIKYVDVLKTNPGLGGEGGRSDIFFYVHKDDMCKLAFWRLGNDHTIKWWEDVLDNGGACLYPKEFVEAHPRSW